MWIYKMGRLKQTNKKTKFKSSKCISQFHAFKNLTGSFCALSSVLSWVELTDEQALEAQQQVQGGRTLTAMLLRVQARRDAASNVLQSGYSLRRNISKKGRVKTKHFCQKAKQRT